jgi:hypothetical protein
MNPQPKGSRLLAAALLGMTIANGLVLWNSRRAFLQGYGDFSAFYTAGTLVRRGQGAQIYDRNAEWKVQQEFASEVEIRKGPLPYIRPPFEALLFAAFAAWPYPTAVLLWSALKLVLLFSIPLIVRWGGVWRDAFPPWAAGLLALGTYPVFMDFLQGQDSVLLAFLFAIAYWQLARGKDGGAGFALGLGLFKFHLVLPFVAILWLAGRKRILSGFVVAAMSTVAASLAIVGWRGLLQYPGYLYTLNRAHGVGVVTPEYQINLRGLLTLFVGRSPYPGPIHWALLPIGLVAIFYSGTLWRKARDRRLPECFGLALITVILTSYYAYTYDLTSLVVPLLAMRTIPRKSPNTDWLTGYFETTGILLLLFTPLYWFVKLQFQAEFLMTLPLLAVGFALVRRLRQNEDAEAVALQRKAQ